jgi:hypothetical protein
MKTTRMAVGVILGAALFGGCYDRSIPTTASGGPELYSVSSAGGQTSVVLDPMGDATKKAEDYEDIVRSDITKQGGNFTFVMELAAAVPVDPPVPSGADVIVWVFGLDTDPAAFPDGYPHGGGPFEFFIELRHYRDGFTDPLDPTRSAGVLVDRRPLLSGGQATVTPIQFSIEGAKIAWVADAASLGDPSTFQWSSGTCTVHAPDDIKNGYNQVRCFDQAPSVDIGEPLAIWPQ